jgi:hypothetical protein
VADARRACGIEIFPKQDKIKKKSGYGNLVWLPWWSGAPEGANEFYRLEGDSLVPFIPESFETIPPDRLAEVLTKLPGQTDRKPVMEDSPTPVAVTENPSDDPAVQAYLNIVENSGSETAPAPSSWKLWREKALAAFPLESVYGPWLTGAKSSEHWFECRDPDSPSGDQNPSAGVAVGTGDAPRGTFHSFRTGENTSVFDFMIKHGLAGSFGEAVRKIAEATCIPLPEKAGPSAGPSPRPLKLSRKLLPEIIVNNRQFRDVAAAAWSALHASNNPPSLFVRMGGLVRVAENWVEDRLVRQIESVSEMALYDRLSRIADWVREGEDSTTSVSPSKDVVRVMEAVPSVQLPPLSALAEGPVFARDGSLIASPGYHREAALWLDLPEDFDIGDIPDAPTPSDIAWARSLFLDDLLVDYPFVAPSDRAHAVAAVILPFVRRLIPGRTPIHLVEAPTEGSGKGYLCHAVSIISTGQTQGARTLSHDDDEARKMITSELSTGRPIILLDNADDKKVLSSPSLASVITADTWTDRQLGQTRMLTMPNNAVWLLTGNNPKLSMELARRCVRIRIEPREERPHLRKNFKHAPFLDWVHENRPALVRAAIILVKAWMAAGKPLSAHRLGSFERWAQTIGGILEVAGIPGFLGNLEALYETADLEGEAWREFISVWWEEYATAPQRVVDLVELCEQRNLLSGVRGDGSPRSQQTKLGYALMSKRDRVYGELQLVRLGRKGEAKCIHYALRPINEAHPANRESEQQNLFDGGTLRTEGNHKNEVPQQGSPDKNASIPDSYGQRGNLGEPFSNPRVWKDTNGCNTYKDTRAQEVTTHMGVGEKSTPRFPHIGLSPCNDTVKTGVTSVEQGPPSTLPTLDLADFDDEGVEE